MQTAKTEVPTLSSIAVLLAAQSLVGFGVLGGQVLEDRVLIGAMRFGPFKRIGLLAGTRHDVAHVGRLTVDGQGVSTTSHTQKRQGVIRPVMPVA